MQTQTTEQNQILTNEQVNEQIKTRLDKFGYTFAGEHLNHKGEGPAYFYTIGLVSRGWPEIILSGNLPEETALSLIEGVIRLWERAQAPVIGLLPNTLRIPGKSKLRDLKAVKVAHPDLKEHYMTRGAHFFPDTPFNAVQLYWPDPKGNLPGDKKYSKDPRLAQMSWPKVNGSGEVIH